VTRILIVDDKDDNVYYLRALLEGHGCAVESTRHGAEALVKARQTQPDLVISDLLMPVMDGYTLLRLWKADARLKQIPFIVYTATYTDPEDERLALSLGADAFILKPCEPEAFLAQVHQAVAKAVAGTLTQPKSPTGDEKELLKVYSETLIRKLEEKTLQLEASNRALQQDVLERKMVEEELRWKTAFLEAQVDSSMDGILVVDTQGRKTLQNQRLSDLWKIPAPIAENPDDAVQVEFVSNQTKNPRQFADRIHYLNAHPNEVSRDEIELADGTILDRYSSPVRDKAGRYYGRIWTFRDITEQRKLEMQFRQSQKMEAFGQLAGGVAHDFNNILAVIQLQAGLVKSSPNLSQELIDFAGNIEDAAERGANLTHQLLFFSRKQMMQPQNLQLEEVISSMTRMLGRTLGEHIQLQFKFFEEALCIQADRGMIDQILLNLTVNARDAMPKGGNITIETSAVEFDEATAPRTPQARPGSFVCLSVADEGCGIPPEILPRIFEPFFTTKEVGKGTGLGLATVFGIVQQHKGWINVDTAVGRGTTFRVYLPRSVKTPDDKFSWPSTEAIRGGNETILLVEDESALRSSVRIALSRLGYQVLEAANGAEALEVWQQHAGKIRLLLTDLMMPGGMLGRELAEQLLQQNPDLKVVFTSGYSLEIVSSDFPLEEGFNFLTKPFEAQKLAHTIRKRLDQA
jgi:two-component system cell cycle sensor histidine kinase/response regulator CckA